MSLEELKNKCFQNGLSKEEIAEGKNMKKVCSLESHIIRIEKQTNEIIKKRETAMLQDNKTEINTEITELNRLNKLMESISKNINDKKKLHKNQLDKLERERLNIVKDVQLSPAEKEIESNELNDKIIKLRETQQNEIKMLNDHRKEIDVQFKLNTKRLHEIKNKLKEKHERELKELQMSKQLATGSEVERINIKIQKLNKQFDIDNATFEQISLEKITSSDSDDKDEFKNKPPIQTKIDYIKENLGLPLKKALASTVIYQPNDPIEYITNYLITFRESEIREMKKNEFLQDLMKERSKFSKEKPTHYDDKFLK